MPGKLLPCYEPQDPNNEQLLAYYRETSGKDYTDVFEFHPFSHALRVEGTAASHLARLEASGVDGLPTPFELRYAALKHDSGLPEMFGVCGYPKLNPNPYDCPEELSIKIAKSDGRKRFVNEPTLNNVGNFIGTTKAGVRASTWGGFVLCIADIGEAGGDYDSVFLKDGERLHREWLLTKGDITLEDYRDFSVWIMAKYLVQNLGGAEPFSQDIDPAEFFAPAIEPIAGNVIQLATQRSEERHESLEAYSHNAYPLATESCIPELLGFREAA